MCRWLAFPRSKPGAWRVQQLPRDARPCGARPAPGADPPAYLAAPRPALDAAAAAAAAVARGLGARAGGCGVELQPVAPDGQPLLGSHPGFEEGRVVVAAGAGGAGAAAVAAPGQLAPVLARAAVQLLLGRPAGLDAALLGPARAALGSREGVGVGDRDRVGGLDTWEQLAALQAAGPGELGYEAGLEAEQAAAHLREARAS